MINSSNTIQKLILDLQVQVDKSNDDVFNKFSSVANSYAIPTIQSYFDSIIPKDIVIEMDHLELDLGLISYEDLDTVFTEKLLTALKNIFEKYFGLDGSNPSNSNELFTIKNLPDNYLAFVKYYLLYGRAPWWANAASPNFNESILQITQSSPAALRTLLYDIGRTDSVRKRLAFTLNEEVIKKVIVVLEPSESEFIVGYHVSITKINKAQQTVKTEEKQFKRSLWYVILTYIIYNRGGNFNRREFLKQNLYNVSSLYNIKYVDLLTLLYKALSDKKMAAAIDNGIVLNLFDNLFYLAQEAKVVEINDPLSAKKNSKNAINKESSLEDQLGILHYYLERGSFPIASFHYSRSDIITILDFFINHHSELFYRYLKTTRFTNQMAKRLFDLLPNAQYNKLIQLLTPRSFALRIIDIQKSFILFLINRQVSTQVLIGNEWKLSILCFIIDHQYSFSPSGLIDHFIKRLSDQLQLSYINTLALYENDLKRQMQIKEYSVAVLEKIAVHLQNLSQSQNQPTASSPNVELSGDTHYYGIADLLKFVIVKGYLPWWGKDYLNQPLSKLMADLFSFNIREAVSIFNAASSQMLYRNRFIQFFTSEVTVTILSHFWKGEDEWKLFDTMGILLNSLPANVKQPSDIAKKNILIHAFWKTLLDGNFSVFNNEQFIQFSFLLLKKYHSFELGEILKLISPTNPDLNTNDTLFSKNHIDTVFKVLDTHQISNKGDALLFDSSITINIWFELVLTTVIFGNKKLSKSRKIKEIESVLAFFLKNLVLPPYVVDFVKVKPTAFFSFLLGYLHVLDRSHFQLFINQNSQFPQHPDWLVELFHFSENSHALATDVYGIRLMSINDLSDFDNLLNSEVYKKMELSKNLKVDQIVKLVDYYFLNLSFPTNLNSHLLNKQQSFFSYLLSILSSLDSSIHREIVQKGLFNSDYPVWLIDVLKKNNFNELPPIVQNVKIAIPDDLDVFTNSLVFQSKELGIEYKAREISKVVHYFIDHLSFPSHYSAQLVVDNKTFFAHLVGLLFSIDPLQLKDITNNSIYLTNKPAWLISILKNLNFSKSTIPNLSYTADELYYFEGVVQISIFENKELSPDTKIREILKFIDHFVDRHSFPSHLPEFVKNKQNSFFTFLMELVFSISTSKFKEISNAILYASNSPVWLLHLVKKIIKDNNLSVLGIGSINLSNHQSKTFSPAALFENDDLFISTLLGFKPFSIKKTDIQAVSGESLRLLLFLLNNNKLPNKYLSLNRYDSSFLVTILFRYLFSNSDNLFNQVLLKFSSFPDASRLLLFKLFSGNSNHPFDQSIAERLIPFMTFEIDLQQRGSENDNIIKSNKISINVTNKLNEWINDDSLTNGFSRLDKMLELLSYYLHNGKLYDSFSSLSGSYLSEFLRILLLEIIQLDSRKLATIFTNSNNDPLASLFVLNLFSNGVNIEERRAHSLLQSFLTTFPKTDLLYDSFHEFDIHPIDPSFDNIPFNDVGLKDLFNLGNGEGVGAHKILLDNSVSIFTYFLLHKKKDPQLKKIPDNHFLNYLKEMIGFIFSEQATILRELLVNPVYSLTNKVAVYSLYIQSIDSKENAIKVFLQPIIENEIFKHIGSLVNFNVSTANFKEAVNILVKSSLTAENSSLLKLLQFVHSADLTDELTQVHLSDVVSRNMSNTQAAYLKQVLALFHFSLSNFQDRSELSNLFIRFNSYLLSDLTMLGNLDIYLRKLIQFLLYQNRTRALYFFSKFIIYTENKNFSFSTEYSSIVSKLRKIFTEFISAADIAMASELDSQKRDQSLLDKISEVVTNYLAVENPIGEDEMDVDSTKETYKETDESIYLNNAGLVLFNPFITTYFSRLGITENGKFKDEESTFRAIHLLQLLVTDATYEEHELVLNKILCNLPVSSPIPMDIVLKPAEKSLAKELIEVAMKRWKKGSSGSKESFRASFINRDGRLSMINEEWHLKVDQRGYDVILQTLPWSFGMIKLPWMLKPLIVEWI